MLKAVEAHVVRKFFEVGLACFAQMELSAYCKNKEQIHHNGWQSLIFGTYIHTQLNVKVGKKRRYNIISFLPYKEPGATS